MILFVIAAGIGSPALTSLSLEVTALAGALLCAVHVVGALQRVQPWTEDVEIVLYGLATLMALSLRIGAL